MVVGLTLGLGFGGGLMIKEVKAGHVNKMQALSALVFINLFHSVFEDTALMMLKRIETESPIRNPKIKKITDKKYRVYLGPFNEINSLQKSYNDISILQFENIEIIKND